MRRARARKLTSQCDKVIMDTSTAHYVLHSDAIYYTQNGQNANLIHS